MSVCPPIVTVPERLAPALTVVVKLTDPLPTPADPEVTEIHAALVVDVHAQPAVAVTAIPGPAPPPAPIVALAGLIEYEQLPL